jgi:hypothetical protein
MAGRRQHTIPKLLLKGFASSTRGKVVNVWYYRKDAEGIETNIDNVSAERDFYGTDLDDRITVREPGYALLVNDLRAGTMGIGPQRDRRIAELVAHLSMRTRSLRQSAIGMVSGMADGVRCHMARPDFLRNELRKKFGKREMIGIIRRHLADEGRKPVEIERLLPKVVPRMLPLMERFFDEYAQQAAPALDRSIKNATSELPATMRKHLIEALSSNLEAIPRARAYAKFNWFVVSLTDPIILGDSVCLFEATGARRFKPLNEEADNTTRVFLPLALDRLLVGAQADEPPEIDVALINNASARCSLESFVSSRKLIDSDLQESIGKWAGLLTEEDTRSLIDDFRREFRTE